MQAEAFEPIERYAASVNDFLDEKRLVFHRALSGPNWPHVALKFLDGTKTQLRALSSGERQIVCMLFAAADSQLGDVVLIDEPELSLHVDWQRKLLQKMNEQLGLRQMIVCTHSPEVGADFLDNMIEVMPTTTSLLSRPGSESDDELPDDLVLDEVEF